MRALILALLLLAGCVENSEPQSSDEEPEVVATEPSLPDNISDSKRITGGLDPLNFAGQGNCATPENQCQRYMFEVNTTVMVDAALTWGLDASDFDLYLDSTTERVASAGDTPPETIESFTVEIGPGSYELLVVPWAVADDTYQLEATFTEL